MSLLEKILHAKRSELGSPPVFAEASPPPRPGSLVERLRRNDDAAGALGTRKPLRLITEIKFRSPSAGPLSTALSAEARGECYARAGAAMISVLCDQTFFDGGWHHLAAVRRHLDALGLDVPLLAKEFVVDARQVHWAREAGADAVLVIARIVSEESLRALVAEALAAGLEPLVEVTNVGELQAALATQARLIGVNARDLDTLTMDSERAAAVVGAIPPDRIALHLSGIKAQQDVLTVAQGRADGALIGEILMRQEDPGPLLREWSKALQRASSASQPLAPPRP